MNDADVVAGLLLTGGQSRRLGQDKARLPAASGTTLAAHVGRLLAQVTAPAIEVGPGWSGLEAVTEHPPGDGPLSAAVTGWQHLRSAARRPAHVLVLAVDLPYVTPALLGWLARYPSAGSVVPVDRAGRAQPLAARYAAADLDVAVTAHAAGERAMRGLVAAAAPLPPAAWEAVASGDPFADLDEPADLDRYRRWLAGPGTAGRRT